MWALVNRTPYPAERTWTRDKTGAHHWVVAVRATYSFDERGRVRMAEVQQPPLRAAEYFGDAGASSVKYEADLGPLKPATDLTLIASAYAERGRPAERVLVGFRIGSRRKALFVYGDRVYVRSGFEVVPSRPRPFSSKPIRYETAYGGMQQGEARDPRNPVGRGFAANRHWWVDRLAHDIEFPDTDSAKAGPAGFSPIASDWWPRRAFAGTYDEHWMRTRRPLLPDDYDERFAMCAPADQQSNGHLLGGELLELMGMTPDGPIRVELPRVNLRFSTHFGAAQREHPGVLSSVIVEPDERKLSLVWQTSLLVASREVSYLDETRVEEVGG